MATRPTFQAPLLIGITGKRKLSREDALSVETRLRQVFRQLDAEFPNVPKVLLTGGAYGADTIAAEILAHPGKGGPELFPAWSIAVQLPFEQELFEKDFRPEAGAAAAAVEQAEQRLAALRRLLTPSARGLVRIMPPLYTDDQKTSLATHADLDKDNPGARSDLRHAHYEQVGQSIAEAASVLIAVVDGSEVADTSANGGTARIVAYRRAGFPDAPGRSVAERSRVLRSDWGALVAPPAGYVWLIEPSRAGGDPRSYPVVVLPPIVDSTEQDAYGKPAHEPKKRRFAWPTFTRHGRVPHLGESLVIVSGFERLHAGARSLAGERPRRARRHAAPIDNAPHGTLETPWLDVSLKDDPAGEVGAIRATISNVQGRAKRRADVAFRIVAILFVLAVLSLEIFVKFLPKRTPFLLGYLCLFLATCGVVLFARYKRWQPQSEDYRAVNEMLRVQRAWWSAGLDKRIDHLHLQAVDLELTRIRDAVRTMLGWTWLRSTWATAVPERVSWAHVRGRGAQARETSAIKRLGKSPADWIGGQIYYFARNEALYRRKAQRLTAIIWSLFATSAWIAASLCFWLAYAWSRKSFERISRYLGTTDGSPLRSGEVFAFCLVVALAILWLWCEIASRSRAHGTAKRGLLSVATILVGLGVALLCTQMIEAMAGWLAPFCKMTPPDMAESLTDVWFVTISAIAGAIHYVSEKLNYVVQAFEYRDALGRFERAERLLAKDAEVETGTPADEEGAKDIVKDLALLALTENEAWLKARRERPLSPVIG